MQGLLGVIFRRNWFFGDPSTMDSIVYEFIQLTIRKMHYENFPTRDNIALLVFISCQYLEYAFKLI